MKLLIKSGIILGGLLLFAGFFLAGVSLTQTTPKVVKFFAGINSWEYRVQEQTVIYYSDQKEMGKLGYKRDYREDLPKLLKDAVVAVEDRRFYQHSGIDAKSIGRAIYNDLRAGSKAEGASTITQQLARTLFLTQEKSYFRKIKEIFIATAIEDKYTKEAILNMYLNEIYVGRGCSGMATAASSYFGKEVSQLNKAEITMLAGIIQAPEYYSPDKNMAALKRRQQMVVDAMVDQGIVTAAEGQEIMKQKLNIQPFRQNLSKHPYYMYYLSKALEDIVGAQKLYGGGLKIYTTVDSRMQDAAQASVIKNAASFKSRGISARDVALVSIDPGTGGILAMVGGVDWEKNQINMAVAPRQPGSAIKPLYYAAAINEGIVKPDTVFNNAQRDFNGYSPDNYEVSPDKATVKEALVHSYNVASVELLNKLGVTKAVKYLADYGITSVVNEDKNLALALGGMSKGISPLQLASAYSVFVADGRHEEPFTVVKIVDAANKVIYTDDSGSKRVISSNSAKTMDAILKAVVNEGTGSNARIAISSGGKTGTTEGRKGNKTSQDLWYVGYTSEIVTAVWVGNSDNAEIKGLGTYGGTVAGPVWRDYMNQLINKSVLKEKSSTPVVEETPAETPATPSALTVPVPNTTTAPNGSAQTTPAPNPASPSKPGTNTSPVPNALKEGTGQTTPEKITPSPTTVTQPAKTMPQ